VDEIKNMVNNIDNNLVCSGRQVKELLELIIDYCEFEIECQKKVHKFHQTIINHYKAKLGEE
jgi:hypothetical protein